MVDTPQQPLRLAFFPWLRVEEPGDFGRFRLVPYQRAVLTPGVSPAEHERIRLTLRTHRTYGAQELERATLVAVNDHLIAAYEDADRAAFFEFREHLAFSALAKREFFGHRLGYLNRTVFAAVVAPLATENGLVVVSPRSRVGPGLHMWDADHLITIMPPQADHHHAAIDRGLMEALARAGDHDAFTSIDDAIRYFNAANTDADDVDEPFEMVLTVAAFQRLLGTQQDLKAAKSELRRLFALVERSRCSRWAAAKGGDGEATEAVNCDPVVHWWSELHGLRGAQAHGARSPTNVPRTRPDFEHLLLGAWFFPRLFKIKLWELGLYGPTADDLGEFEAFPAICARRPLIRSSEAPYGHAWSDDIGRARSRWRLIEVLEEMSATFDAVPGDAEGQGSAGGELAGEAPA